MTTNDYAQTRYTFFDLIDRTESAVFHRCRHSETGEMVVAKHWIDDRASNNSAALREFDLLNQLSITGIPRPIELWDHAGIGYLITENYRGVTLKQFNEKRLLSIDECLTIAIKLTKIVSELHRHLIAHNNINPSNIAWNAVDGTVTLIGFDNGRTLDAISGRYNPDEHAHDRIMVDYTSPEHFDDMRFSPDYRSDLYSIGATLYFLLTGSSPFSQDGDVTAKPTRMAPPPMPSVALDDSIPAFVSKVVLKLLATRPRDRYQSAYGLLQDLSTCRVQLHEVSEPSNTQIASKDFNPFLDFDDAHLAARPIQSDTLLQRFNTSDKNTLNVVLLTGTTGIGKTATVDTFLHQSMPLGRTVLRGKCEQLTANHPYSVWVQAIDDFVHTAIAEGDAVREEWADILKEELGPNLSVITDLAPSLKHITGEIGPTVAIGPAESKQRFFGSFVAFLHCICKRLPNPVLFIDDLHWADQDSLELFYFLYSATPPPTMLLIATLRQHALSSLWKERLCDTTEIDDERLAIIELLPFTTPEVSQHLANLLTLPVQDVEQLATVVLQKTAGNPLFVNQFLFELANRGHISFDHTQRRWSFNIEAVHSTDATDNVVDMLTKRLKALSKEELTTLSVSACIGRSFTDRRLSAVVMMNTTKIKQILANLQNQQLIRNVQADTQSNINEYSTDSSKNTNSITTLFNRFEFEHDRIWQSAYEALPLSERQRYHKLIGESLLANRISGAALFEAVDHLNLSDKSLMSLNLQVKICELNLDGARDALKNSAFELAKNRFLFGLHALPDNCWDVLHDLSRDLHLEYAELCSSTGDHATAHDTLDLVKDHLTTVVDRGRATYIKVTRLTLNEQYADAIAVGISGLEELGIFTPVDHLSSETDKIINELRHYDLSRLAGRRRARLSADPELAVIMAILMRLLPPTETYDSVLNNWIAVKMAHLSLTRGLTPESAKGIANFGTTLVIEGDYSTGHKYGQLALNLIRQPEFSSLSPRVLFNFLTYVNHWRSSFDSSRELAHEALDSCREYGDVQYRDYIHALNNCMNEIFVIGKASEQAERYKRYLYLAEQSGNGIASGILKTALMWLDDLQRSTRRTSRTDIDKEHLVQMRTSGNFIGVAFYHVLAAFSHCLDGNSDAVREDLSVVYELESYLSTTYSKAVVVFTRYMATIGEMPSAKSLNEQPDNLPESLDEDLKQMRFWFEQCSENFGGFLYLMNAECYRIQGRVDKVLELYDRAISIFETDNRLLFAAYANERGARFWGDIGKVNFAREYLRRSLSIYRSHGAQGKHARLSEELADLLIGRIPAIEQPEQQLQPTRTLSGGHLSHSELDYRSLLESTSRIASELRLKPLIAQLLRSVMQHTAARRTALFLVEDGSVNQFADFTDDNEDYTENGRQPDQTQYPLNLLNYVVTIQDPVTIDNLELDHIFRSDSYFTQHTSGALACIPVKHQGVTIALIYLENDLIPGVFDDERMEVLHVLRECAASSLHNSLLYTNVEQQLKIERAR